MKQTRLAWSGIGSGGARRTGTSPSATTSGGRGRLALSEAADVGVFAWTGVDRFGRKTGGEMLGPSSAAVRDALRRQGIAPRRVHRKRQAKRPGWWRGSRVGSADVALFSRQMATMMRAGVPLVRAFDVVAKSARNPRLVAVIHALRQNIAEGASLTSALAEFPAVFDSLYVNLIGVGERSGALEPMLERIATYQERTQSTRRKLVKAMTYPCVVVLAAAVVTMLLLIHVVPQFETVFAGVGADLPGFTRFVIGLSDNMRAQWPMLLGGVAGFVVGYTILNRRSARFRDIRDRCVLRLPVAGQIVVKAAVARFARTLTTSLSAGMPLVDALRAVVGTTGNVVYAKAIERLRDEVATGQPLAASMRDCQVFPHMIVQMVAIGEEAGSLDDMLARSATHYESLLDAAVDSLTALVEPLLMAILGVVVGGLVVAMYLPVFQLGTAFGG
ncbi:MAG: type II secretion system F family protein [Gammaproteobacteria bacterium]|nr:type II secretion system F family protein [Gammaproteobacteria bacterium]